MNIISLFILIVVSVTTQAYDFTKFPDYSHHHLGRHKLISESVQLKEIPTKIIKITKTVAIKVPVPYPVKIPVHIPVHVPVNHAYPYPVPQIVKVPEHVPYPVTKHVPVELHQQVPIFLNKPIPYPQPFPVAQPVKIKEPVPYPVPHPVPYHQYKQEQGHEEFNQLTDENHEQEEEDKSHLYEERVDPKFGDKSFDATKPIVVDESKE